MTDALTRVAEADAAKAAWDRFIAPMLAVFRADYLSKLTEEAVKPMEGRALQAVQTLSLALRLIDQHEAYMRAIMIDGQSAQADIDRAGTLTRMSPEARRFASY